MINQRALFWDNLIRHLALIHTDWRTDQMATCTPQLNQIQSDIERFDPATGNRLGAFGSFSSTRGMTIGPDGLLYVGDFETGQILRFNPTAGTFLGTFVAAISTPTGLVFGPDGSLYVCSGGSGLGDHLKTGHS